MRRNRLLPGTLGAIFVAAGTIHLVAPQIYLPIMPPYVPYHRQLIAISGVCEFVGGVALLPRRTRRLAGYGLIALLVAVFPANIQMALNGFQNGAPPLTLALLLLRLPLQPLLIALVYLCGWDATPAKAAQSTSERQAIGIGDPTV